MRFIRENLFYVVLIGLTVVGAAVGLVYYLTSDIGDRLRSRASVSSKLSGLSGRRATFVPEKAIQDANSRIETLRKSVKEDIDASIEFNRANLPILRLSVGAAEEDAFPIDLARYRDLGLDSTFIREYEDALAGMLAEAGLAKTSRATKKEIDGEEAILKDLVEPPFRPKAVTSMKIKKAEAGRVFIEDNNATDPIFIEGQRKAPPEVLWRAQVNLWVTGEILRAIAATNEELAAERKKRGVAPEKESVLSSAVKRLEKINVNEDFILPRAGFGESADAKLTRRVSAREYAVIQYNVTLEMPPRHVPRLLRTLMTQNYHVVTNVSMGQSTAEEMEYYLGIEPAAKVTVYGELLLLSDWITNADEKLSLMPPKIAELLPTTAGPVIP